ncbi:hypothetical protein A7M48_22890 [Acinetobacter baumannii]|nr:hypothetical protein A7M48_22890 [Acinetobacter baumannii]
MDCSKVGPHQLQFEAIQEAGAVGEVGRMFAPLVLQFGVQIRHDYSKVSTTTKFLGMKILFVLIDSTNLERNIDTSVWYF